MKNKILMVLILTVVNVVGENKKQRIFESSKFIVDLKDDTQKIDKECLEKHIEIIENLLPWLNCQDSSANIKQDEKPMSLIYWYNEHSIYSNDHWRIEFDKNGIVSSIHVESCTRSLTIDEQNYFNMHNKISPSILNIDKKEATIIAKKFFNNLLKKYNMQNDTLAYDSVFVSNGQDRYIICFRVRAKNHISDTRSADVSINPNNGQLLHFYTYGLLKKRNMNYKPKISYEQFTSMIDSLKSINELHMNNQIKLELRPGLWQWKKWIWVLWGCKVENCYTSSMLVVDSETGKILTNQFKTADK